MGCSIHDACLQARQMDWLDACIAIGEKLVTDVTEVVCRFCWDRSWSL